MVRIANPIYDSVFKHLLENQEVAIGLISSLLRVNVVNLEPRPQEVTNYEALAPEAEGGRIHVFRLDFSADIELEDGQRKRVLIEIQKANTREAVNRFRDYLGKAYRTAKVDGTALPIVAIYFLGFWANKSKPPVVLGRNTLFDAVSLTPLASDQAKDAFFNALRHDAAFVQIPALDKLTGGSPLELALRLFDQSFIREDRHFLTLSADAIDHGPLWVRKAFRILQSAASDEETQKNMGVEDEVEGMMRDYVEAKKELAIERGQKEEAMRREAEALLAKEEAIRREEEAMRRAEEAQSQNARLLAELEEFKKRLSGGD
jgi:hypothetical protein